MGHPAAAPLRTVMLEFLLECGTCLWKPHSGAGSFRLGKTSLSFTPTHVCNKRPQSQTHPVPKSGLSKFQEKYSCNNLTSNCKLIPPTPSLAHFHHWVSAGQIDYNSSFRVYVAFFLWTHPLPYPLLKTYTWWSCFSMGSLYPPLLLFLRSLASWGANH